MPDRSQNTSNVSLGASLNHDKEIGGVKTTHDFIHQNPGEACLITAHTMLALLGNINAMDYKLQTLIQKMNQLIQDLAPLRNASLNRGGDPSPETAPGPLLEGKGGESADRGGQEKSKLLLMPMDIVLNFPSSDACWWINWNRTAKSLSWILKRHITTAEIQKFLYLPSFPAPSDLYRNPINAPCKRLYLSFATSRTPKEIFKHRLLFESLNIYSQRAFRQINSPVTLFKNTEPQRNLCNPRLSEQHPFRQQLRDNGPVSLLPMRVQQSSPDTINVASDDLIKDSTPHIKKIQPNFTSTPSIQAPRYRDPRSTEPVTLYENSWDLSAHSSETKKKGMLETLGCSEAMGTKLDWIIITFLYFHL